MDITIEEKYRDTVGIVIFSKLNDVLTSVAMRDNGDAWTYFGGDKREGEPGPLAAQRHLRELLNIDVSADDLVAFARTSDSVGTCTLFSIALDGNVPACQWALSQLPKYLSEMALDVPVMIEMAKLALMFPNDIFFTAEMR
jgi:hypothetical protein